ncbi:type III pantothenate kinase [Noviherbaspirillum humi]|nr:type III pantothenate kinase [Noviherbaspirillum humi]
MLLLIDAGNTRVKWALLPLAGMAERPLGDWSSSGHALHAEVPSLVQAWRGRGISRVLASNVAGAAMRERLQAAVDEANKGGPPTPVAWFSSRARLAGVVNRYRNPAQLGCDRFASAIGAHALYPDEPLVVATCGTATTVDAVTADGAFLGGMILPGLGLMASSLARNTAQLPEVAEHLADDQPFADHTDAAIVSGCLAAQAGAIERGVKAHQQMAGGRPVRCLLSGGAATLIQPHLAVPATRVDNLVLIGLQAVARDDKPC